MLLSRHAATASVDRQSQVPQRRASDEVQFQLGDDNAVPPPPLPAAYDSQSSFRGSAGGEGSQQEGVFVRGVPAKLTTLALSR